MQTPSSGTADHRKLDFSQMDQVIDTYYKVSGHGLIPVLHTAQSLYGHLSAPLLEHLSQKLDIPLSEITSVVSFYPHFTGKPKGRHEIKICLGTACYLRGGRKLVEHLRGSLHTELGGTTKDGRFTLTLVRCIGACGAAPAVMVDGQVFPKVSPGRIDALLKQFE